MNWSSLRWNNRQAGLGLEEQDELVSTAFPLSLDMSGRAAFGTLLDRSFSLGGSQRL